MNSIKIEFPEETHWINEYGQLHNTNGPALESKDGTNKEWYQNGKLHREDGPAVILDNAWCWYLDGQPHRTDGPAYHDIDGINHWYIYGVRYKTEQDWFDSLKEKDQLSYIFKAKI